MAPVPPPSHWKETSPFLRFSRCVSHIETTRCQHRLNPLLPPFLHKPFVTFYPLCRRRFTPFFSMPATEKTLPSPLAPLASFPCWPDPPLRRHTLSRLLAEGSLHIGEAQPAGDTRSISHPPPERKNQRPICARLTLLSSRSLMCPSPLSHTFHSSWWDQAPYSPLLLTRWLPSFLPSIHNRAASGYDRGGLFSPSLQPFRNWSFFHHIVPPLLSLKHPFTTLLTPILTCFSRSFTHLSNFIHTKLSPRKDSFTAANTRSFSLITLLSGA